MSQRTHSTVVLFYVMVDHIRDVNPTIEKPITRVNSIVFTKYLNALLSLTQSYSELLILSCIKRRQ